MFFIIIYQTYILNLYLYLAEVWIDLLLGLLLLCIFVTLLLFNWLFSSPILPSFSSDQSLVLSQNELASKGDEYETFTQKKKRNNYREFLAIGCDASIVLFWISFSRSVALSLSFSLSLLCVTLSTLFFLLLFASLISSLIYVS